MQPLLYLHKNRRRRCQENQNVISGLIGCCSIEVDATLRVRRGRPVEMLLIQFSCKREQGDVAGRRAAVLNAWWIWTAVGSRDRWIRLACKRIWEENWRAVRVSVRLVGWKRQGTHWPPVPNMKADRGTDPSLQPYAAFTARGQVNLCRYTHDDTRNQCLEISNPYFQTWGDTNSVYKTRLQKCCTKLIWGHKRFNKKCTLFVHSSKQLAHSWLVRNKG